MSEYAVMPYSDYQNICNSVRAKTGGTDVLKSGDISPAVDGIKTNPILEELTVTENGEYTPGEGVDGFGKVTVNVESAGGGANPLDYAITLQSAFSGVTFEEGTELELSIGSKAKVTMSSNIVYSIFNGAKGLKSIKIACGGTAPSSGVTFQNAFRAQTNDTNLESIDLSNASAILIPTSFSRMLELRLALREILGEFDMSLCTNIGAFCAKCAALETIRFKAGTIQKSLSLSDSPNLTDETIQNIIDGLADLTGGTAQTLTFHTTVGAKLTDAQKSAASAKNWTISY